MSDADTNLRDDSLTLVERLRLFPDVDVCAEAADLIDRLERDGARLDYLDRDDVQLVCGTRDGEPIVWLMRAKDGSTIAIGKDIREAIDRALAAPTGERTA